MKGKVSLAQREQKKIIFVTGLKFIKEEYRKRLKIENNQVDFVTEDVAWFSYVKRQDIYHFVNLITNYAKQSDTQVILDEKMQNIVQSVQNDMSTKTNNIKVAETIKSLINNSSGFKNHFDLNLLKENIKQYFPSNYKDYFKIFNNISKTINKIIKPEFKLYYQQEVSVYHHIILGSACNFSVPGAGKTLISLMIFYFLKSQRQVKKLLLIAPLSSYISWKDEYLKFINGSLKEDILNFKETSMGSDPYLLSHPEKKIIFINYEKVSQNKELLINFLKKEDVFLVFDEVHKIKNFSATRTQSAKEFFEHCENKLLLTGTPMPKGYEDLVTYFEAIPLQDSGYDIDFLHKTHRQLQSITKNPMLHSNIINKNTAQIKPFYIRINKKDLNLGKAIIIYWTDFKNDEKHQKIYKIIENKLIYELKSYEDKKN